MKFDGRKTGWAPSTEIRKDDDGLENIQDFFQEFPEEERRPQEFYYDEYEGFNRFDKEFPRENYRYEGEYQYQERPIRMPIQVPVMRSPFVYEEPIRVQVTPQYVPRRSVPGSVPVRRVYQSPVYQQAPPKRYPPNPYLNQPQPGIYKNYAEPPRSQPRPRRTPGRDEEYWRQKESEESEESDSKLVIPLQIEAPPSPVKYSPVKHSPRPTASSSRSVQQKQPKKKSAPAPKKVEALEEEEDVQPFRKRLGMTNRMKPTKTMPKPAPTLTAEVLEKDAVYTPLKESPELTVEEVVEEKLEAPVEIATPPVVHSAKKVDELDTKVNPSLLEIQKPVSIATPAVGDGAPVSTVKAVAEKIADSEGIVALEAPVPVQFAEEPIKKNSKAKSTKMIISSSEDDNDAPVAEPSFSKPEPKKDSGSHGRFEKSLELQEDVVPATQFESQSTNNFPNEDFNDDFGSPSGYPQYEPKAVVDSDENVSPTRSYANSDRSAIENSPVRPPPKKKSQNEIGKHKLTIVKKTTKPKSVKPKKEKAVVKSEFKRPHPVAPVVVHVERPVIDESDTARRSKRAKIAPVAFWKNEKVIYSRRESGIQ